MLFVSLISSGILFIIANTAAVYSQRPLRVVLICGIGLSLFSCVFVSPATPLLTVLYCLLLFYFHRRILPFSIAAFLIVFALLSDRKSVV